METTRQNSNPSRRRSHVDAILAPDPGPTYCSADRWYRDVTTDRALEAARRRHEQDLRRRYADSRDWADYSVRDLRLPMTQRQTNTVAVLLLVSLVVTVAGLAVGSAVVTFGPLAVSAPVSGLVVRDVYRRVALWMVER